ncbi:hypothetical protein HNQ80_001783 [Anaerosolibacter carboniphilus]|uniref:Uncharacterized protein n=1 Tax=Anaerosolibacter carboniphilus TaxID=1417629 RepID=A0A841KPJ3_9FIRM|nr:hypothetical protein [Anaerosolibacter carboniphilus]MBB6215694.1 hypothetical protein [Anaerosolibacter carboniphilus]
MKKTGMILIVVGSLMLYETMIIPIITAVVGHSVKGTAWVGLISLLLIIGGMKLILGKKHVI